jgi:hypothetical protein
MGMCEVNALEIEIVYFLNKSFLFMECLKSARGHSLARPIKNMASPATQKITKLYKERD